LISIAMELLVTRVAGDGVTTSRDTNERGLSSGRGKDRLPPVFFKGAFCRFS